MDSAPKDRPAGPPCLSVIIPNYNHAAYLEATVCAHLNQSHPPLEILVVDDLSTDSSIAVVEALCARSNFVKLIRRAERGGPNAALISGLSQAQGDFIMFASADDLIEPMFAEHSIAALRNFPAAAFTFMDPSMYIEADQKTVSVPLYLASEAAYFPPSSFETIMRSNYFTISSNSVVYRRDAIKSLGGFRPDLEWQADWMANLVLAFRHGACYLPMSLATVRVGPMGYSWAGLRDPAAQRRLLYRVLDALRCDYADVAPAFRRAALIPEMRLRNLYWLLTSADHRAFLTARLCGRLIAREIWTRIRPFTPLAFRSGWRRCLGLGRKH